MHQRCITFSFCKSERWIEMMLWYELWFMWLMLFKPIKILAPADFHLHFSTIFCIKGVPYLRNCILLLFVETPLDFSFPFPLFGMKLPQTAAQWPKWKSRRRTSDIKVEVKRWASRHQETIPATTGKRGKKQSWKQTPQQQKRKKLLQLLEQTLLSGILAVFEGNSDRSVVIPGKNMTHIITQSLHKGNFCTLNRLHTQNYKLYWNLIKQTKMWNTGSLEVRKEERGTTHDRSARLCKLTTCACGDLLWPCDFPSGEKKFCISPLMQHIKTYCIEDNPIRIILNRPVV